MQYLRDQVLLNARPRVILWYNFSNTYGYASDPGEGYDRPDPKKSQQRTLALKAAVTAPIPKAKVWIKGPTHWQKGQTISLRVEAQGFGGIKSLSWSVGGYKLQGKRFEMKLAPGLYKLVIRAADHGGRRISLTKRIRVKSR